MNVIDKIRIRYKIHKIAKYTKGLDRESKEKATQIIVNALRQLSQDKKEGLLDACINALKKCNERRCLHE